MSRSLRISFIEYLNAMPLGWGFLRGSLRDQHEIHFDVPARCAEHLRRKEVDVGLIPVIEYQRIPDLRIVPGISISSKNEAKSVLFVSKRPIESVSTVAVDESSRTSVALLEIILRRFYARSALQFEPSAPDLSAMLLENDAALLIGNAALQADLRGFLVYDLAKEWSRFTGLPFVFAFWAACGSPPSSDLQSLFEQSRKEGLEAIDEIADEYAARFPVAREEIHAYLTSNLDYSLDRDNFEGLNEFFRLAHEEDLIPSRRPLNFF